MIRIQKILFSIDNIFYTLVMIFQLYIYTLRNFLDFTLQ